MRLIQKYIEGNEIKAGWKEELKRINISLFPTLLYVSLFGILCYSVFDYFATPENWFLFLVFRIILSIIGLMFHWLMAKQLIEIKTAILLYECLVLTFFSYGASILSDNTTLMIWNLSIVVAGCFWPYFLIVIEYGYAILINIYFTVCYLLFFYSNSSFSTNELMINGGVYMFIGMVASPFLAYTRYNLHMKNYSLNNKLNLINLKLDNSNNELQKANAAKDRLFSIIAHDLKSPFNSLLGLGEILLEEIKKNNIDKAHTYAKIILDISNQSYNLLSNLLDWSITQTSVENFKPEIINIEELCNDLVTYYSDIARSKSITINSKTDPDITVFADKNMLSTVIRNLLSNAIKYSFTGGKIQLFAKDNKREIKIIVQDFGIGIRHEKLKNLFNIENYISTSGTENEKGTGLGLVICKDFIDKHNGKIWAESNIENGCKICFTIPHK